jgi:hypothetical protein
MTTDPDTLAAIAMELTVRVRDEPADDNARWLTSRLPDPGDWFRLAFVLAAAVPDDRTWASLTAWTQTPRSHRRLQPHGSQAAASRHRYHHEPLCDDCREGERVRDRARKRDQRRAAA